MSIVFVGIDLAKNVFALHGVNDGGAVQLRQPKVARGKLHELVAALPPCTIGIEACSGAHHCTHKFRDAVAGEQVSAVGRRVSAADQPLLVSDDDACACGGSRW